MTPFRRSVVKRSLIRFLLLGALLAACGGSGQPSPTPEVHVAARSVPPAVPTATATATRTPLPPTFTPTPAPPTSTPMPTATPTNLPTPTPTPPHPLTIEWLRQQEYPGSEIVIEETLTPGVNYSRYVASYRSEGLKIYALLTVPKGEKPASGWPAIVFNHGYIPPDEYRTTERYVAYVDGFARNGYIVLKPDYRGHGRSEGEATSSYGRPDYTVDVLNAVAAVKAYEAADPDRIGMWGHSMGGHITLRSMVATGDIKAGVIWAGVVASYPDLLTRWSRRSGAAPEQSQPTPTPRWSRRWRDDLLSEYGTPEENPQFWASISANSFLDDLSGPIQLHHGTADESVPLEFSATLYGQIQHAGQTAEFYTYEGDNHDIDNSFSLAMQRSIAFFATYVKGTAS